MTKRLLLALAILAVAMTPARAGSPAKWAAAVLPSGEEFSLEVVTESRERALGYMFREQVGPTDGMLFIFDTVERHGFWMKNCKVALDIVWLDDRFAVLEVARDQQPCLPGSPCPTVTPLKPARYVLEVAAGNAPRHGLKPGARVIILSELPEP